MNKIHKRILTILLAAFLLTNNMGVMAQEYHLLSASEESDEDTLITISPFWLFTNEATPYITFKSGVAYSGYSITGASTVTQISTHVYLQRQNTSTGSWENIKDWSKTHYSTSAVAEFSYTLTKTGKYRTKLNATVYNKGTSHETMTTYSNEKNYS